MEWKLVEDCKPNDGQRVWIYLPFFPERWKFNVPEVISIRYMDGKFHGIGSGNENQEYVKAWIPWVEVYSSVAPRYIQPERSKREDS